MLGSTGRTRSETYLGRAGKVVFGRGSFLVSLTSALVPTLPASWAVAVIAVYPASHIAEKDTCGAEEDEKDEHWYM